MISVHAVGRRVHGTGDGGETGARRERKRALVKLSAHTTKNRGRASVQVQSIGWEERASARVLSSGARGRIVLALGNHERVDDEGVFTLMGGLWRSTRKNPEDTITRQTLRRVRDGPPVPEQPERTATTRRARRMPRTEGTKECENTTSGARKRTWAQRRPHRR